MLFAVASVRFDVLLDTAEFALFSVVPVAQLVNVVCFEKKKYGFFHLISQNIQGCQNT